jgi:hypothetical protein
MINDQSIMEISDLLLEDRLLLFWMAQQIVPNNLALAKKPD